MNPLVRQSLVLMVAKCFFRFIQAKGLIQSLTCSVWLQWFAIHESLQMNQNYLLWQQTMAFGCLIPQDTSSIS